MKTKFKTNKKATWGSRVLIDKSTNIKTPDPFAKMDSRPVTTNRPQEDHSLNPAEPPFINQQALAHNHIMNKPEPQASTVSVKEVFSEQNLVYQSDDMQVYSVSGEIDINQLRSLSGGSEEFAQRHDWRIVRQLESMKEDLLAVTPAHLQVLEEKLEHLEEINSRLQDAEEQLKQHEEMYARFRTTEEAMLELRSKILRDEDTTDARLQVLEEALEQEDKMAARVKAVEERILVLDALVNRVETENKKTGTEGMGTYLQDVKAKLQQLEGFCNYLYALVQSHKSGQDFNFTGRTTGG